jgi:hypothetical protein
LVGNGQASTVLQRLLLWMVSDLQGTILHVRPEAEVKYRCCCRCRLK